MGKDSQRKWHFCWTSKDEQDVHGGEKGRAAASWMGTACTEEEGGQNSICCLVAWGNKSGERWMRPESRLRQGRQGLNATLRMGSFSLRVIRVHHRSLGNRTPCPVYQASFST